MVLSEVQVRDAAGEPRSPAELELTRTLILGLRGSVDALKRMRNAEANRGKRTTTRVYLPHALVIALHDRVARQPGRDAERSAASCGARSTNTHVHGTAGDGLGLPASDKHSQGTAIDHEAAPDT